MTNKIIGNGRSDKKIQRFNIVQLSQYRRTVIGILTEPLKGDLIKNSSNDNEIIQAGDEKVSYVPKSHVQFLEQVGIRVVPISYLSSPEQILELLGQVNGVYMPGDSHKLISNRNYIQAFAAICNYAE